MSQDQIYNQFFFKEECTCAANSQLGNRMLIVERKPSRDQERWLDYSSGSKKYQRQVKLLVSFDVKSIKSL